MLKFFPCSFSSPNSKQLAKFWSSLPWEPHDKMEAENLKKLKDSSLLCFLFSLWNPSFHHRLICGEGGRSRTRKREDSSKQQRRQMLLTISKSPSQASWGFLGWRGKDPEMSDGNASFEVAYFEVKFSRIC